MVVSCHHAGQNHNLLIGKKSFESLAKFKYLVRTIINQNYVHKEIKSRLNTRNVYYQSVQSL
jgi:hypothetical protein